MNKYSDSDRLSSDHPVRNPSTTKKHKQPTSESSPAEKARGFPTTPGVYLMKDRQGRVIYIGKAKNLRHRASSYFTSAALLERRTADLVP
ncbi:MAG: nucleotide excision repair endonuclease, partial [Planctomycetota bacterium]|nr:nucleotide excision repair endonuclease [Planctomycetota bacterium]